VTFVTVNGVQRHYAVEGTGVPCIVPSTLGGEWYQRAFSAALRQQVQRIFVDVRGTGRSEPLPPERATLALALDDLDQLRQRLGLVRVAMLGHSRHGYLPLAFARDCSQSLSHVIAVGALPGYGAAWIERLLAHWAAAAPPERQALLARNEARLPEAERANPTTADHWIRLYNARAPFFSHDPAFDAAPLCAGASVNLAGTNRLLDLIQEDYLQEDDLTASFPRLTVPVLLALGQSDYSAPPALWDREWQKLPRCTRVVFDRSGHGPMFEEPAAFDAALVDWLRR
jgi:proline iminopeptidase